jgi:hypothetical protein
MILEPCVASSPPFCSSGRTCSLHPVIDCLVVEGNVAWVSGVATKGFYYNPETEDYIDLDGLAVGTMVRDNGASANDPADPISYSVFELDEPFALCAEKSDYPLFDVPQGQVKAK